MKMGRYFVSRIGMLSILAMFAVARPIVAQAPSETAAPPAAAAPAEFTPPQAEAIAPVYVGDFVYSYSHFPYPLGKLVTIDKPYNGSGPLAIGDKTYTKGIGTEAACAFNLVLNGDYEWFDAEVGLQAGIEGNAFWHISNPATGAELFNTGWQTSTPNPIPVHVSVAGLQEIRLLTNGTGLANWAEARLTRSASKPDPMALPPVDIAPFARVCTWDPARMDGVRVFRLEEFPADCVYFETPLKPEGDGSYAVPIKSGAGCIGLQWNEPRRLLSLGIQFAGTARPPEAGARVEGWVKHDQKSPGEYSEVQGKWVPLGGAITRQGDTWTIPVTSLKDQQVSENTLKIRWVFPNMPAGVKVARMTARSISRWFTADVKFEAETAQPGQTGQIEMYNGEIVEPAGDALRRTWDISQPLQLKVRYTNPQPWGLDRTVARVTLPSGRCGVAIDDVLSTRCVYAPYPGIFVAKAPTTDTLALYKQSIADHRTLLEQVRQMPDQTFAKAIAALYAPNQDRSPTMLSVGWDNRKLVVDRTGALHFGAPVTLAAYQFHWNYDITPEFGVPRNNINLRRSLKDGWLPMPRYSVNENQLTYTQMSFVAPLDADSLTSDVPQINRRPLGVADYTIQNPRTTRRTGTLKLTFNENKITQEGTEIEIGSTKAYQNAVTTATPATLAVEGQRVIARGVNNKIFAVIDLSTAPGVTPQIAGGAVTMQFAIDPGQQARVALYYPIEWDMTEANLVEMTGVDALIEKTAQYWRDFIGGGMQVEIADTQLANLLRASQIHNVLASRNEELGRRVDAWIASAYYCSLDTESHAILRGMDQWGQHDYARRGYEFFLRRHNPAGFLVHGYTIMGTGQHMWFMGDHFAMTGDEPWWAQATPKLIAMGRWIQRQCVKTRRLDAQGQPEPQYGLLPPGTVADWQDWGYTFAMEGYYYAGARRLAQELAQVGAPEAAEMQQIADALRQNIRRAYGWMQDRMPVVPRGNGEWVPGAPFQLYRMGPIGSFYPNEAISLYDVELGPHHMADEGVYDPQERELGWMADYLEGTQFMTNGFVDGNLPAASTRADWFNKGGFPRAQPYYGRYPELLALRDDVKPFIRSYYNQLAIMFNREDLTLYENPWASVWNKTHETGHFLQQSRLLFLMERGNELWLAPFAPNHWLQDDQHLSVQKAPSFFGNVGYRIDSHVADGYIEATVDPMLTGRNVADSVWLSITSPQHAQSFESAQAELPAVAAGDGSVATAPASAAPAVRNLSTIVLRLRHPDGLPMKRVLVNGVETGDFDAQNEIVRLTPSTKPTTVRAEY